MTAPRISIITATLNSGGYLEEAIRSVLAQDYRIEYIVVDGGSTDSTLDIIRKYESHIARWISEPDYGISDAFNKGIRMAAGDIISVVSADDYLLPGAVNCVVSALRAHPDADVIYGNSVYVEPFNNRQFIVRPDVGLKTIWRRQPLKHAATFVTRNAYERFGLFDTRYRLAMDYELILRFYVRGAHFVYVDQPLAAFRFGGASMRVPLDTIREEGK